MAFVVGRSDRGFDPRDVRAGGADLFRLSSLFVSRPANFCRIDVHPVLPRTAAPPEISSSGLEEGASCRTFAIRIGSGLKKQF